MPTPAASPRRRRSLAILLLLAPLPAAAQSLPPAGARALGMGGAFVAVAQGATATYWNPAALPLNPDGGSLVYGRTTADPEGLAPRLDDLAATDADELDVVSRPTDALRALELLGAIAAEPEPVSASRPFGAFYSGTTYGFSAYRVTVAEATPVVDGARVEVSTDPERGLPFNESRLAVRELRLDDYVFSVAGSVGDPRLLVGASVRYSRGRTRVAEPGLFGLDQFQPGDVLDAAKEGAEKTGGDWSFDLATLLSPHPRFRLGLLAKYLGTPSFEAETGPALEVEPRWRAGVAVLPHAQLTLSADLDLARTSLLEGREGTRELALGGEVTFARGRVALRGGFRDAIEGPGDRLVTGGVGFGGKSLRVDAAAGYSPRSETTSFAVEVGFARGSR